VRLIGAVGALALVWWAGIARAQQSATPPAPAGAPPPDSVPPAARDSLTDTLRITRAHAIAEALAHNPQLAVAHEQTAEARAQRIQTLGIPDPTAAASLQPQHGQPTAKPVTVAIDIPFPDKFRLQYGIGTAGVRQAQAMELGLTQVIASQTAQTYDSLRVSLRHQGDLAESLRLAQEFLGKTQARFAAGTAAKLDVIQAEVAVAQAQAALLANGRAIANARSSLNRLVGRPLRLPIAPADTLDVPPPLPDLASLEAHALAARPELTGLDAQRRGAHASTVLAEEFWLPDIIAGSTWDFGAPDPYYPTQAPLLEYGISLPVPIFFWQHVKGEIAQARHHELELAASYRDTYASVDQDVRAAFATARTALDQVEFLRDHLLPAARDAYRVASVSYGLGGSSAIDVLQARQTLVAAESQYTDALAAANEAEADLARAAAEPVVPSSSGAPNAP
jgi:outer membrane protein, heavy metal efflux system